MKKTCCLLGKTVAAVGKGTFSLGKGLFALLRFLIKLLWPLLKIAGIAYLILFIVFYFDLDGKLLYTVVEPNLADHYSKMERRDNTATPYDMKKPVDA